MGYTHYWYKQGDYSEDSMRALVEDVKLICKRSEIPLAGMGGEVETQPEFTELGFGFNGVEDDSHETFSINIDDRDFEFCKTEHKPYDAVVTACLLLAKFHLGESIQVKSDGNWVLNWIDGCRIFNYLFPDYDMVIPDFVYS